VRFPRKRGDYMMNLGEFTGVDLNQIAKENGWQKGGKQPKPAPIKDKSLCLNCGSFYEGDHHNDCQAQALAKTLPGGFVAVPETVPVSELVPIPATVPITPANPTTRENKKTDLVINKTRITIGPGLHVSIEKINGQVTVFIS